MDNNEKDHNSLNLKSDKENAQLIDDNGPFETLEIVSENYNITYILVITIVIIYIITSIPSFTHINPWFLQWGGFESDRINEMELWRLITANLLHSNLKHLLLNCISLAIWGFLLEKSIGKTPLIVLIIFSAMFTDYFTYIFLPGTYSIGASGIAYGMMFAFIIYLLAIELLINPEEFKKQIVSFVVLIVFQILANFYGDPNLNIWGHLGGSVAGILFMIMYIVIYRDKIMKTKEMIDTQQNSNETKND